MGYIKEIFDYREMIKTSLHKELRGKYKGSFLGFLWTFLNPLLQLIVYTVVFSYIMKIDIENYYIYLFVALVPWLFFSTSIQGGATSILAQANLIKKIYFPRIIIPISYVLAAFVNMLLTFVVVFAILFVNGMGINFAAVVYLPIVMLAELLLAMGIAVIASAVTVYIRDLEYIFGIIVMVWMYWTPVFFTVDMIPEKIRAIYYLNPMIYIIDAYRDIFYYQQIPDAMSLLKIVLLGCGSLIIGFWIFIKLQRHFVEEM